jgi:hypothetical protein
MKPSRLNWLSFSLMIALLGSAAARAEVIWHVSFKVILDSTGNRPSSGRLSDSDLQAQIDFANTNEYFLSRGFRLKLDEIIDLDGVSQWFGDPDDDGWTRSELQDAAEGDPSLYEWETDAINIYVNDDNAGGMTRDIIQLGGPKIMSTPWTVLHEIGHFMSLSHTHSGQQSYYADGVTPCSDDDLDDCSCPNLIPGDDGIADTLPDHECWEWSDIAAYSFPATFAAGTMTAAESKLVDNVRYNIMSYHSQRDRLTSDQLDAMADTAAGTRNNVTDHRTWFVDKNTTPPENGLSYNPFNTIQEAVNAASERDVIIIRGGTYDEPFSINKAVTLHASRRNAIIGL